MNISQRDSSLPTSRLISEPGPDDEVVLAPRSGFRFPRIFGGQAALIRAKSRRDRDEQRGYSINIKQVVLAFAVELVIITLILISQYFYAIDFAGASQSKTILAFLFPVALAVVELARVPLALAVRTQNRWYMQFAALLGVACAVVVTSASLYQIGHYTFKPRLKRNVVEKAQQDRDAYANQRALAQQLLQQKIDEWTSLSNTLKTLSSKYPSSALSNNCTVTEIVSPDNAEGGPPKTNSRKTTCAADPAFKAYQKELAETKASMAEVQTSGQKLQDEVKKFDLRPFDETLQRAETEYRDAIYQSQLHSYSAMLFGKDPRDISEGEVKTLEWYLILIPSIAAALSSTLIALTAVRRIERRSAQSATNMPDEALTYLFGPLVTALNKQAKDAVAAAMNTGPPRSNAPSENKMVQT
jgi:hypothetical protein